MKTRYQKGRYPNLIRLYRDEMSGNKRLGKKEEEELAYAIQNNRDRHARDLLALSSWKLVTYFASRFQNLGVEYLDLIQAGNEALLETSESYDGSSRFSTYATWRVRGMIVDEVRNHASTVRIARWRFREWKRINKVRKQLSQKFGRRAEDWEIAKEMDILPSRVRIILHQQITPAHFEDPVGDKDGSEQTLLDTRIGREKELGPEERLDAKYELESSAKILKDARNFAQEHEVMSKRDGRIFCRYFGLLNGLELDTTLREVGKEVDLTEARISQICKSTLEMFSVYTPHQRYTSETFCEVIYKVQRLENLIGEIAYP